MSYLGDVDMSDYETVDESESECEYESEYEEIEIVIDTDLVIIDEDKEWVIDIIYLIGQELEIIEI